MYENYRGRNTGRVIYFLTKYFGHVVGENAHIGNGIITLWSKPFADFTWSDKFGEGDIPEFKLNTLHGSYNDFFERCHDESNRAEAPVIRLVLNFLQEKYTGILAINRAICL